MKMNDIREVSIGECGNGRYVATVKTATTEFEVRGRYDAMGESVEVTDYDDNPANNHEIARLDRLPTDPLYHLIEMRLADALGSAVTA
jgi:hypothetical protein